MWLPQFSKLAVQPRFPLSTNSLLSYLSPATVGRIRQFYYNFQFLIGLPGTAGKISLKRQSDYWLLSIADQSLCIAYPNRLGFYKFGIKSRLHNLLTQFGVGSSDLVKESLIK